MRGRPGTDLAMAKKYSKRICAHERSAAVVGRCGYGTFGPATEELHIGYAADLPRSDHILRKVHPRHHPTAQLSHAVAPIWKRNRSG